MTRLSIRWKLTLWYGGVLAAVLVAFGMSVFLMMRGHLLARTDLELDEELHELGMEVSFAHDEADLRDQLQRRFGTHESFVFQVARPDGQAFFRSDDLKGNPLPVPDVASRGPRDVYETSPVPALGDHRIASRFLQGPGSPLVIQVAAPLAPYRKELNAFLLMLMSVGPVCVAGALGGGYLLARKAMTPVERMTAMAEQISAEQLERRLEVPNPQDELGRLAMTLNRMIDRLARSINEMRQFTADAAHELRTPLAVLRTEAEVALRAARSADEYRRVVEATLEETNRLTALADQLLQLCRHEGGLNTDLSEEVRLDALLMDVADQIRQSARQKNVSIDVGAFEPWTVEGNDVRLSQLLFNLLDNAVKYTPSGGTVSVEGACKDGQVEISVQDTGIGISPEHLPHIFKRFYRVDESRTGDRGGTGLGLAICKAVVDAHHGRISVESEVGRGTRVTVVLSALPTSPAAFALAEQAPVELSTAQQ